jgi:hypothetical protein
MLTQPLVTLPKEDPVHIDKTRFKPFMKQEKQHQQINNLCLYCGKPSHVVCECPKKFGPHVAHAIFITNPQLEELRNEHA